MSTEQPPVLLLAAGLGTRLRPLTDSVPKCLLPVAGRPMLDHWQDRFVRHDIREVTINLHAHAAQVRTWIKRVNATGPVRWSGFEEAELLGSAGTLRETLDGLESGDDYLVVYADNLSDVDLTALVRFHRDRQAEFTMALFHAENPRACGIATLDDDGRISDFTEKPQVPDSDLANAGIYVIRTGVMEPYLTPGFLDMGYDVIPRLAGRMHGWVITGYHRDIGTLEALEQAEQDVLAGRVGEGLGRGT